MSSSKFHEVIDPVLLHMNELRKRQSLITDYFSVQNKPSVDIGISKRTSNTIKRIRDMDNGIDETNESVSTKKTRTSGKKKRISKKSTSIKELYEKAASRIDVKKN